MKRPSLALLILSALCAIAQGQSLARVKPAAEGPADQVLAQRAITALRRLDSNVIVYHSLGEFEETKKLARVSFDTFNTELREVTAEVESILVALPDNRLKTEIRNSLGSYRDGAFWWARVYQPRVINAAEFAAERTTPSSEAFLLANAPYTVAIHWRLANKYLQRAETILNARR